MHTDVYSLAHTDTGRLKCAENVMAGADSVALADNENTEQREYDDTAQTDTKTYTGKP